MAALIFGQVKVINDVGVTMKLRKLARHALFALILVWSLTGTAAEVKQSILAGNLEIFYGVMPAEVLRAHPSDHTERTMHGGVPGARNTYHLIVSVFDTQKRERIADARVQARVSEAGLTPQTKPLQSMLMAGVVTYGNYFTMTAPGPFRITLDIAQPHGGAPVQVNFEHRHR
jgi:hypothetical protein